MLKKTYAIVSDALEERSLDWRTCFTRVRPSKPGGDRLIIEASDEEVLRGISARLERVFPGSADKFSFVKLPAGGGELPDIFIVSGSVGDVRKEPDHASELLTQVICGDVLEALLAEGDWVLVRLDDAYIGWIRSWNLKPDEADRVSLFMKKASFRIGANIAQVLQEPDSEALPLCDAVAGTPVFVSPGRKRGWRKVELPDGRTGFIKSSFLAGIPDKARISRDKLAASGMRFLGIPYVWGGTTPKGFDCSGLMQRIFRLNNRLIPRDADMQGSFGVLKPAHDLETLLQGDLMFFGKPGAKITHVAMYLSNSLFLHAYGYVRVGSMDPGNPLFDSKLAGDWRFSRDVLSSNVK